MLVPLLLAQLAAAPAPVTVDALVARARASRYQQDSTLAEYRTLVRQRASAGFGLSEVFGQGMPGRERLAARTETVARMGWHHQSGAWAEVIGGRTVVPFMKIADPEAVASPALVLPYIPGADVLWPTGEIRDVMPNHEDLIHHPLDTGADSVYQFTLGDSISIKPSSGRVIPLREIRVRPRRPSERLIVGSLWVDATTGSLVRAAYRPSVPLDLWPYLSKDMHEHDENFAKQLGPFEGHVREIIIEHGFYDGRFWLPRMRTVSASGTAKGAQMSFSIQQTFEYELVRSRVAGEIAPIAAPEVDVDPRTGRVRRPQWLQTRNEGQACRPPGSTTSALWAPDSIGDGPSVKVVYARGMRIRVVTPCDEQDLVRTPMLPPSIYGDGEELFSETDFERLRSDAQRALAMSRQAEWAPQTAVVRYGMQRGMIRYNRIEGLSAGALAERELGNGYRVAAQARIGLADLQPNAEVGITRSNVRSSLSGTAYRRLAVANDWGNPLALGPSIVAALFGRDDGLYYRAGGVEVSGAVTPGVDASHRWRLFVERRGEATVETQQSIARLVNGALFRPNIAGSRATYAGGSWTSSLSAGSDPRGARFSTLTRIEGAGRVEGAGYFRASTELTLTRGIGDLFETRLAGAGGTSLGNVPPERLWYLGGAHTVRGFDPGALAGDAFWFGRAEISRGHPLLRPSLFGDVGWAGSRSRSAGAPASVIHGYGAGFSMLDGLARLDIARSSTGRYRLDLFLDPR